MSEKSELLFNLAIFTLFISMLIIDPSTYLFRDGHYDYNFWSALTYGFNFLWLYIITMFYVLGVLYLIKRFIDDRRELKQTSFLLARRKRNLKKLQKYKDSYAVHIYFKY